MAGFLEKVGEIAKTAADKTSEAIEVTSLKSKISREEQEIRNIKVEIGEYFLELYKAGNNAEPFLIEKWGEINKCERDIKIYEDMIREIKTKE